MSGRTSPERTSSYHSPLRARQAAETRRTVLDAAARLFGERGWAGTTVAAVASEAGTAVETVYSGFASKAGLLIAAIDAAIVGDDEEAPITGRAEFASLGAGARGKRIREAARIITRSLERAVPLMPALREASASDEQARARLERYETDRWAAVAAGLELLLASPVADELVDAMWALASPEVFVKLTRERGWDVDSYEAWLVQSASALLTGAAK